MIKNKILLLLLLILVCAISFGSAYTYAEIIAKDGEGTELGILLDVDGNRIRIYVPSADSVASISVENGDVSPVNLYYDSDDCTGVPYLLVNATYRISFHRDKYYTGQKIAPTDVRPVSISKSYSDTCEPWTPPYPDWGVFIPAQEITVPFTLPVTLPLSFEFKPTHPGKWNK